jgi:Calcineurin-like phosphoesterase
MATLLALAGVVVWLVACPDNSHVSIVRLPHGVFVPSGPERPAIVWAVGDGADGREPARAVARLIASGPIDRLLYLGDVYKRGTASDFSKHYATVYGRLARRTAPTPGNHDWPHHLDGYDPYWRRVTGRPAPAFYRFRLGGWEILSLNSEAPHEPGSAQLRWLRSQLRRPGTCRLAFWHRPRYSDGTEHGDQKDVESFWQALRGHATLVLNGHEHDMQRFRSRDGITELASGAGGHGRYTIRRGDPFLAFGDDRNYGALRLDLAPGRAQFAFVAADGRILNQGHVRCRQTPR